MNRRGIVKGFVLSLCFFFITTPLFAEVGRVAEISKIQGSVWFRKSGSADWKGAENGMLLLENDEIKTGPGATAVVLLDTAGETGKLNLAENTQMRIDTMKKDPATEDKTTLLDVALGKVLLKVEKLQGNSTFQVKTPTSICGVRGTIFEVSVEAT